MQSFVDNENYAFVLEKFSDDVQYTFSGIQHNHSLIDHYIVLQNLFESISQYYTVDSLDNLSDQLPLFCHLSIDNNNLHSEHAFIGKHYVSNTSHWQHASKKQIHDYQTDLDKMVLYQKELLVIKKLLLVHTGQILLLFMTTLSRH